MVIAQDAELVVQTIDRHAGGGRKRSAVGTAQGANKVGTDQDRRHRRQTLGVVLKGMGVAVQRPTDEMDFVRDHSRFLLATL
jgi:hypothetical protein